MLSVKCTHVTYYDRNVSGLIWTNLGVCDGFKSKLKYILLEHKINIQITSNRVSRVHKLHWALQNSIILTESHHRQVAEVLAHLAAPLGWLQRQPLAWFLPGVSRWLVVVVSAVACRWKQPCFIQLLPLLHLYVPVGHQHTFLTTALPLL